MMFDSHPLKFDIRSFDFNMTINKKRLFSSQYSFRDEIDVSRDAWGEQLRFRQGRRN